MGFSLDVIEIHAGVVDMETIAIFICSTFLLELGTLDLLVDEVDDPLDAIEVAESAYQKRIEQARSVLIEAYKKEIVEQTGNGKLENVTRLSTGLQLFESDGLLMEPELEADYKSYGKSLKAARDELLKAYTTSTAKLAAQGKLAEIQEIQQKIRDEGLISKLVSLQLTSKSNMFLMHEGYKGHVREIPNHQKLNATFEMVIGLSTDGILRERESASGIQGRPDEVVSFRAVNAPNHYLVHGNNELLLQRYVEADAFRQNASFKIHRGLFRTSGVSFEAVNYPGHFLVMQPTGSVVLHKFVPSAEFSRGATFNIAAGKFRLW